MTAPIIQHHPISAADRAAETTIVTKIHQHFAAFPGSPRDAYDAMAHWTPFAAGIDWEQVERDGINGWWGRPTAAAMQRAILFVHGGAYRLGSAKAYRSFASQLAARAGLPVFVPDYPLAPEHPFPAAPRAVAAVVDWLATQGVTEVALVGDSAGGALALTALALPRSTPPAIGCVVVFSPWLDLTFTGPSFTSPDIDDPIFKPEMLEFAAASYLAGADPRDRRASPLLDVPDVLPPIAIQVGTDEVLLDDATRYAALAAARGGVVHLDVFEGLHHVFQRSVGTLPGAGRALDAAAAFILDTWIRGKPERTTFTPEPALR